MPWAELSNYELGLTGAEISCLDRFNMWVDGEVFLGNIGNTIPARRHQNLLFFSLKGCLFSQCFLYIYLGQDCSLSEVFMTDGWDVGKYKSLPWDEDCCFPDRWIEFHIILSW